MIAVPGCWATDPINWPALLVMLFLGFLLGYVVCFLLFVWRR